MVHPCPSVSQSVSPTLSQGISSILAGLVRPGPGSSQAQMTLDMMTDDHDDYANDDYDDDNHDDHDLSLKRIRTSNLFRA